MSTVAIRRAARRPAPPIPDGDLPVDPPPVAARPVATRWSHLLMAVPMLAGTVATAMMFAGRDGTAYTYVVGAVFGLSSLGMLATSFGAAVNGPRRSEDAAARDAYLLHLAQVRRRALDTARAQRDGLAHRHPEPAALWSLVDGPRLWERRPGDDDFGVLRVGTGPQRLATPLLPGDAPPDEELEPTSADALRRLLRAYAVLPGMPVAVRLPAFRRVLLSGDQAAARALARALLAQACVLHAPGELCVHVATPERPGWEYLKWLPHAVPEAPDGSGGPYRIVLSDGGAPPDAGPGATVLAIGAPPATAGPDTLVLHMDADRSLRRLDTDEPPAGTAAQPHPAVDGEPVGTADRLGPVEAEALARRLAPLRLAGSGHHDGPPDGFAAMLGVGDPATYRPGHGWSRGAGARRLRVPIGLTPDGRPVELDLKESAQHGMGPHGLVVGATGSGKSELLRTLVLALAVSHDPATLNFVLIDFKGGAAFGPLHRLPHTAAVITNLGAELPLVDRMAEALNGELVRRQEALRAAGNLDSLSGYERARAADPRLEPLPSLLVVCDEFAELLAARPELIELFGQIGRVGRSLGVHLLLASQRLDEGRLRGLDTSLSYRIGLRTFSATESRTVLGVPDAFHLPPAPGHGYLRHGTEPLVRFRAAYVSGPAAAPARGIGPAGGGPLVRPFTATSPPGRAATDRPAEPAPSAAAPTLLDVLVHRLTGAGRPARQVWLPPLTTAPALAELPAAGTGPGTPGAAGTGPGTPDTAGTGPGTPAAGAGTPAAGTGPAGRDGALRAVPIGLVDRPFQQRRDPLWLDLSGAGGHLAVAGGPRSGKSTLIRTVVCALALAHPPDRAHVYCLDFGGGSLGELRGLPHVGGVAGRQEEAAVRRTVAEVAGLLTRRERRATAPATAPDDRDADTFLVIDGWATLRSDYEDLADGVAEIGARGLSYGIHLIVTATRWMDLRPAVRDLFGSRLELRLGDPGDSLVSRRAAADVPIDCPGRGLTADGLHFLAAVPAPARDGTPDPAPGAHPRPVPDTSRLVAAVAAGWPGRAAPPVRMLPAVLPYRPPRPTGAPAPPAAAGAPGRPAPAGVPDPGPCAGTPGPPAPSGVRQPVPRVPIGVAEADLGPVELDFTADPHLMVFGDAGCGKTSFLRALATSITHLVPPERARLVIVDHRRGLLDAIGTEHLIGYGATSEQSAELLASVAGYLRRRLPGPQVTAGQLRERSWWSGPDCFVLVDDHDLPGAADTLLDLLELLPQAGDVGLHVVTARRVGGAARALHDPVPRRLRELATPALVMSGDREEGPLVGDVRARPLPPGRALLVERARGVRLVQLAYLPRD